MKKLIFLIIFSFIATFSNAQVTVIPTVGFSCSFEETMDVHSPGLNAGVLIDFPFSNKKWSFQTGLGFNNLKRSYNSSFTRTIGGKSITFDEGSRSKYNFLEIPANFVRTIDASRYADIYFAVGAYLGIYLGGEELLRSSKGFSDYALLEAYADEAHLGFTFGTGVEINQVLIGLDINLNATGFEPTQFHFKLKMGYRF